MTSDDIMAGLTDKFSAEVCPSLDELSNLISEVGGQEVFAEIVNRISPKNVSNLAGLVRWKARQGDSSSESKSTASSPSIKPAWIDFVMPKFVDSPIQELWVSAQSVAALRAVPCHDMDVVEKDGGLRVLISGEIVEEFADDPRNQRPYNILLCRSYLAGLFTERCAIAGGWRQTWRWLWHSEFPLALGPTRGQSPGPEDNERFQVFKKTGR